MIPKLIHFVWIGGEPPEWAKRNMAQFATLNPDHMICLHGEGDLLPEYRELYDETTNLASKGDLIRYSVLEQFGGWYMDMDMWPFRRLADAERAWSLDGRRLFVVETEKETSRKWLGNAVLAASPDSSMWPVLRRAILDTPVDGVLSFGPHLMSRFAREHGDLVEVSAKVWWYGFPVEWSGKVYRRALAGDDSVARWWLPETGGQYPYAMHLWARNPNAEFGPMTNSVERVVGTGKRPALIAAAPVAMASEEYPYLGIARGLAALGFRVEMVNQEGAKAFDRASEIPELVVVWNGRRQPSSDIVEQARRMRIPVLYIEHGFWQRRHYSQADVEGNLHRSSWRHRLGDPAPPEGAERLAKFCPNLRGDMRAREHGHILVIGQVPGDTQMDESEVAGPVPLQKHLINNCGRLGVPMYFRPHPQCSNVVPNPRHKLLPRLEVKNETDAYRKTQEGTGLADALRDARFVITINSNAGNEALAAGIPVLAFGPSLYTIAGVAKKTTLATLLDDVQAMLDGWCPEQPAVTNYLQWLACRQWSPEEFAKPDVMQHLLEAAGVPV